MAKPGQYGDVHESFVELLRTMDRQVLIEWIGAAAGLPLPEIKVVRERSTTIAVLSFLHSARKGLADLVLMLLGRNDRVVQVLILELQLSFDWTKRWIWPLLATAFAAEIRRTARVVVFSPDPQPRDAIRRRMLPKMEPRPILIEPDQIPMICDAALARRQPRETIFAALYHARETGESIEERVAGIRAAVIAVRTLEHLDQLRYGDLMLSFTPDEVMQRAIDELRESGALDAPDPDQFLVYRDSYAYKMCERAEDAGRAAGEEAGRAAGQAEQRDTMRRLLIDILAARSIAVTEATRARIEQCDDIAALTGWCTKASIFNGSPDDLPTYLFDAPTR